MTIAIVPLKATSERTPGKNFRALAGKPLYRWVMEKMILLRNDDHISAIFLYCDDETWGMIDADILAEVFHLLENEPNSYPEGNGFFRDMAYMSQAYDGLKYKGENIMFVNVTAPFTMASTYSTCCLMAETDLYDSAVTAVPLFGRLWNKWSQSINHDPKTCPRTQTQKPCWIESESAWVIPPEIILEHHRRVGFNPYFHPVNPVEKTDINYLEDFDMAEILLKMGIVKD